LHGVKHTEPDGDTSCQEPARLDASMITSIKARLRQPFSRLLDLLSRLSGRRVGLALVYHRVDDLQQDTRGHLVAALGTQLFEAQVRHLGRRYRLVAASELVAAACRRRRGQRLPVAITFDDDLPSHVGTAMPILRRVGAPATFFLSGASLSAPHAFWWERLQIAFDSDLLSEADLAAWTAAPGTWSSGGTEIRAVAEAIEAMPARSREQVAEELLSRLGSDAPDAGMRADAVRALVDAGFEVGFHTLNHDALPQLDADALKRALEEGRDELAAVVGQRLATISYPHGKADRRVAAAARQAGYRSGFTTEPEPVTADSDPLLIGRLYPAYDSLGRFALDVSRTLRKKPVSA
jgi:peptidoglycan/xylan/chitin deacetylase (PgdA/CDA1 family)